MGDDEQIGGAGELRSGRWCVQQHGREIGAGGEETVDSDGRGRGYARFRVLICVLSAGK